MRLYSFPLKDTINKDMENYINSFGRVMNYCNQIEQLTLPIPKNIPSWFAEAEQKTSQAKSNALLWKNSVGGNLLHMPEAVLAYQPIYKSKTQAVQNLLQILADHPDDQNNRSLAARHLTDLQTVLLSQKNAIKLQTDSIRNFGQKFNTDIANLNDISQKALKESTVDQEKIKELKKAIEDANALVSHFDTWITVGEIAIGAGLAIIGFGLALSPASTPLIVVGIVAAGLGGAEIIALEIAKSVEIDKIRDLNKELTDLENTVKTFTDMEYKINTITEHSANLEQDIENVNGTWNTIGNFADDMLKMIHQEQTELDRDTLLKAVHMTNSANQAADSYYELLKQISPLKFNFVNRTQLIA